jgi:hypothetical protein
LTNLLPSCVNCLEIWESQLPGSFGDCKGIALTLPFTFLDSALSSLWKGSSISATGRSNAIIDFLESRVRRSDFFPKCRGYPASYALLVAVSCLETRRNHKGLPQVILEVARPQHCF